MTLSTKKLRISHNILYTRTSSEAKFVFGYGVGCRKTKLHLRGVRCRKN